MKEQTVGTLEQLEISASCICDIGVEFDINAVKRFMDNCHKRKPINLADAMQATVLIESLIHGATSNDNVVKAIRTLFEIPQNRQKRYPPEMIAEGSEVRELVIAYILAKHNSDNDRKTNKTRHVDTVKKITKLLSVGDREAERIIKDIKEEIQPLIF